MDIVCHICNGTGRYYPTAPDDPWWCCACGGFGFLAMPGGVPAELLDGELSYSSAAQVHADLFFQEHGLG